MAKQGIMDYSLLLVIETVKMSEPEESRNQIKHGDKVYHIGIIDYL